MDDAKLGYYMDEVRRADTGSKVGIFRGILGFMDGESVRAALVRHAQTHEAFVMQQNEHGVILERHRPDVRALGPNHDHADRLDNSPWQPYTREHDCLSRATGEGLASST